MAELTDVELLTSLGTALAPPPARPDDNALAQLHTTLQELEREFAPVDIATAAERRKDRRRTSVPRTHRGARSGFVAASAIAFALTAGVAAAAVATNTLPGPTRAFAYDVGLPVTSPGLHSAQQSAAALHQSILSDNVAQQRVLGQQLITELKTLNASDLSQIRATADTLLADAGLTVPTFASTSGSSITPTVTTPSVSVPSVSVPSVSVPTLTTPTVTVPSVTTPSVRVPTVTTPVVTVPTVTVPGVSIPKGTVPSIPLPVVTIPIVHLPGLP